MATKCTDYDFSQIESHWQSFWAENKTFRAENFSKKPKYYVLDMFPYPSGAGLHAGHPEGYTASDILARYHQSKGYNVLHPMGWDAFGLPAEQFAVKTGTHPAITTKKNISNIKKQIQSIGFAIDWDREINTTDPGYYKWTQWIFLQLFKHGLAYVDERPVWWCPELKTVLANEEVIDGKSERGNHPVERRNFRQWVLKITDYAEKLLEELENLDWPDSTKRQQKKWIGRSEGTEIHFSIEGHGEELVVFTTRPDTLFGATFMVIAPEHPLVSQIVTSEHKSAIADYVEKAKAKSDLDRTDLAKEKSGVFTGSYALNPLTQERIPIWVADYVLMSYGTGAIMAVPAHDTRDHEFAEQFELPITQVIEFPNNDKDISLPFSGEGALMNSHDFTGVDSDEARGQITQALSKNEKGKATINYKLRDWLFSRQRYWGEPFPILWVEETDYQKFEAVGNSALKEFLPEKPISYKENGKTWFAIPLASKNLPLTLPETESFQPSDSGESPLANCTDWVDVFLNLETGETIPQSQKAPSGDQWVKAKRETNTMPQWAGSCWYHLRYLDPTNDNAILDSKIEDYWQTPDFYIGGAEHAVLHLLYARFWHRFLYDIGVLKTKEPYRKLFHQGIILGEDGEKMSKSRGNVVNPEVVMDQYGADSLRLFEMFLGPLEAMKPWSETGIEGVYRFLKKSWRELAGPEGNGSPKIQKDGKESADLERELHVCIQKVTEDIENLRFNTAISQLMIMLNHLGKAETYTEKTALTFVQLLAPFAPHLAEELWERLGQKPSVANAEWPKFDASKLVSDQMKIVFQVNGKLRGEALLDKTLSKDEVLKVAKENSKVATFLDGKTLVKEIYVPGKIVNLVVK